MEFIKKRVKEFVKELVECQERAKRGEPCKQGG
jgi:hypothetical protein